jgi:aryl-alcohol dehydrogenase-like predicted oxidoreductase
VGAIGLGLMTFDQTGAQPRAQLAATVRAAVDAGVRLFDTADAYGPADELGAKAQGENERLIAGLLDELGLRDEVLLATKGGHVRTDGGGWDLDSAPEHLRAAVDASLQRLGVEQIALWQHHRPDPKRDYADVLVTLKEIHASGKVRMVGISNADPGQIRLAHSVLGDALVSVQNEFSPASAPAGPRSTSASNSASRSCPGHRSAGSPAPRASPTSTPRSRRWPSSTASAPSASPSRGSSRSPSA